MIFFGSRSREVVGDLIQGNLCPECGRAEHQSFGVQNYFHIYWIPVFPTSKTVGLVCTHCKKAQTGKELPPETQASVKEAVFSGKSSLPLFTGTLIIVALIAWGVYATSQDKVEAGNYLAQPAVADLYVVDLQDIFDGVDEDYRYGVLRVISIDGENLDCIVGATAYSTTAGPRNDIQKNKVEKADYFNEDIFSFTIEELQGLLSSGAIKSVER